MMTEISARRAKTAKAMIPKVNTARIEFSGERYEIAFLNVRISTQLSTTAPTANINDNTDDKISNTDLVLSEQSANTTSAMLIAAKANASVRRRLVRENAATVSRL